MSSRREQHQQHKLLLALCAGIALVFGIAYLLARMGPGRGMAKTLSTQPTVNAEQGVKVQSEAELLTQSKALEIEGLRWQKEGAFDKAIPAFRAAAAFQERIHTQYPSGQGFDIRRLLQLKQLVEETIPRAIYAESVAFEQKANSAAAAGHWEAAAKHFSEALERQQRLNNDYPRVRQVSWARMHLLEERLATVKSENSAIAIERLIEQAKKKEAQRNYSAAAELWNQAHRQQETLNQNFPKSQHASLEKTSPLKRYAEKASSFEPVQAILGEYKALGQALRNRKGALSQSKIDLLVDRIEKLREAFPNGSYLDPNIPLHIQYLDSIKDSLKNIWDALDGKWLAIPEKPDVMMLSVEVPQALFIAIMKSNPSRNPGGTLPVDSVIWEDVQIFCRYLSWILDQEVRLPTEAEFRRAIGPVDLAALEVSSWHRQNSHHQTHPVGQLKPNAFGYFDLLGNVAEWVQPTEEMEAPIAVVAGGSANNSLDVLRSIPFHPTPKKSRNRWRGFRIVLEPVKD